jgi:hypothetical protein
VIDIGSGTDIKPFHIIVANTGADLLCIDLALEELVDKDLEKAKKYGSHVVFKQGDVLTESIEFHSMDFVFLLNVLVSPTRDGCDVRSRPEIADRSLDLVKNKGRIIIQGSDDEEWLFSFKSEIEESEKILKRAAKKKGLVLKKIRLPKTDRMPWNSTKCFTVIMPTDNKAVDLDLQNNQSLRSGI